MAFQARREARWEYASETISHIEANNCAKGCQRPWFGSVTPDEPGGDCPLLAAILCEEVVDEMDDWDGVVHCRARIPLDFNPRQGVLWPSPGA